MKKIIALLIMFLLITTSINVVNAEELNCSSTLKNGSYGTKVSLLQKKLNQVSDCNLDVDGGFGPLTENCVVKFQKKYNLAVDGVVGPQTCKKLNSVYNTLNTTTAAKSTTTEAKSNTTTNTSNADDLKCSSSLKSGSNGTQVSLLQEKLNRVSDCKLEIDGGFGTQTKNCVIKFQKNNNLNADGVVETETCKKINSVYNTKNANDYGVVTADVLNVREKASTSSKVITQLKRGAVVRIYSKTNNWYKINVKNSSNTSVYAYVSADWVSKDAILVDITTQTTKLYKSGKLKLTAPVVTGQKGKHDTPKGEFYVRPSTNSKNEILRGYNDDGSKYASHVDYWMPFDLYEGIGFHDANWRTSSEYTSNRYKTNGSHGCVNMRKYDAKYLYEKITKKMVVIVK